MAATAVASSLRQDLGLPEITVGFMGQLNREWNHTASDPAACRLVRGWAERAPALRGAAGPDELLLICMRGGSDAVLYALLELAQGDEPDAALAGRIVLQAMLPKVVRIAKSQMHLAGSFQEAVTTAVGALWEVLRCHRLDRRPTGLAANLAMDTLGLTHRLLAPRQVPTAWWDDDLASRADDHAADPSDQAALMVALAQALDLNLVDEDDTDRYPPGPARLEVLQLLVWAVTHHVIAREDARMLADYYRDDAHRAPHDAGGTEAARIRQRRSRAVRRLVAAAPALLAA